MMLRADAGEVEQEMGEWWTRFQDADAQTQDAMLQPEKPNDAKKKRRRRRRRKGDGEAVTADEGGDAGPDDQDGEED